MTITVQEQPSSQSGRASIDASTEIDMTWRLKGSDTLADLIAALTSERPASIEDPVWGWVLVPGSVSWSRVGYQLHDFTITYIDEVAYDRRRQLETGEIRWSGSTTGGTLRITSSLETLNSYAPAGETAPDFEQAINVPGLGAEPEGVDIIVPASKFSCEYRHPLASASVTYQALLETLTGTINNATFYNRPAGEVLFLGSDWSVGTNADPTFSYHFVRMPNLTAQTIGAITGIAKRGHDYLWVLFESEPDATAQYLVKRPKAVYVERIYQESSFASLGIGVS